MISHIRINRNPKILAQGGPQDPEYPKCLHFSGENSKNVEKGRNRHKIIYTYVRNRFIFLLSPVREISFSIMKYEDLTDTLPFSLQLVKVKGWNLLKNFCTNY